MKNAYQKYKTTSVQSASKETLLLMLYEGAVKFVKLAIKACDEKNISDRCLYIGRTYDIILELNNTLDHKVGGDIAKNLEQLYMFMTDQLTQANISGNKKHLEDVLKLLNTLYSAWKEAIANLKREDNLNK